MSGPPNKEQRRICYNARDEYFLCLDVNDDDIYKCLDLRKVVEQKCPKQWVCSFQNSKTLSSYAGRLLNR